MNEDFILVHKSLFEYLYGIYGCDYFILAKQYNRMRPLMHRSPDGRLLASPSTQTSSAIKNTNNDTNSYASYISGVSGNSSW